MFLLINTAVADGAYVAVIDGQGKIIKKQKIANAKERTEKTLLAVEKVFNKNRGLNIAGTIGKMEGIIVVKGPGGFTALRTGVVIANVLAWVYDLPIAGVTDDEQRIMIEKGIKILRSNVKQKQFPSVVPEYGQEPNITISRKK